jgi:hypothetical protein
LGRPATRSGTLAWPDPGPDLLHSPCPDGILPVPVGIRVPREIFGREGRRVLCPARAGVAQLVEQRICNPQVTGSSPLASSTAPIARARMTRGYLPSFEVAGVAERSMAADCKSAGGMPTVVRIHPPAPLLDFSGGSNSGVESQPSKLLVAGSNPVSRSIRSTRRLKRAHVAQPVEHVLGKDGVTSSSLVVGSSRSGERTQKTPPLPRGGEPRTGASGPQERRGRRENYGQAEV